MLSKILGRVFGSDKDKKDKSNILIVALVAILLLTSFGIAIEIKKDSGQTAQIAQIANTQLK